VVLLDKTLRQGQPQAAASFSPGNQWIEHALANIFANPRAVVDHLHFESQAIAALEQSRLASDTGAQSDLAEAAQLVVGLTLDRLCGVSGKVQET
jgi:hypothetical protein